MEDFYQANRLAFILFYEHNRMGQHRYKTAIVKGFTEVCEDLRFSRIACGMVDMVNDKAYAERYIEPQTAPAHIMVREGEAMQLDKADVKMLTESPGDKAVMLAHLEKILKPLEGSMPGLRISPPPMKEKAFHALLGKHKVVIAAFVGKDAAAGDAFRGAAQEVIWYGDHIADLVKLAEKSGPIKDDKGPEQGRKGKGKKEAVKKSSYGHEERERIAFAAVQAKCGKECDGIENGLVGFADGKVITPATSIAGFKLGDQDFRKAVHRTVVAAVEAATAAASKKDSAERSEDNTAENVEL